RREGRLRRDAPACERELSGARDPGPGVRPRDDARARGRERLTRAAAALAALVLLTAGIAASAVARDAFVPNDPLAPRQWYLAQDKAFDAWPVEPVLPGLGVRVAIVDSGIDGGHPELAGRIALAKCFVGGSALTAQGGPGTFVPRE